MTRSLTRMYRFRKSAVRATPEQRDNEQRRRGHKLSARQQFEKSTLLDGLYSSSRKV